MKRLSYIIIFLLLHVMLSVGFAAADQFKILKYSDLQNLLNSSKSELVLVNIFSIHCPACRSMVPVLNDLNKSYSKDKLMIIGLAVDDPEEQTALVDYLKSHNIKYPVEIGDEDLAIALQVRFIPRTLLYKGSELLDEWTGVPTLDLMTRSINSQLTGNN